MRPLVENWRNLPQKIHAESRRTTFIGAVAILMAAASAFSDMRFSVLFFDPEKIPPVKVVITEKRISIVFAVISEKAAANPAFSPTASDRSRPNTRNASRGMSLM
jgi:hypothetical protein